MQAPWESRINGQRYAWIRYVMGIACMVPLFIASLAMGQPQALHRCDRNAGHWNRRRAGGRGSAAVRPGGT